MLVGEEVSPFDYLLSASGDAELPSKIAEYSGNNYILLGLVLLKLQGKENHSWEELDQTAVFPKHMRHRYNKTRFVNRGACASYKPPIAHQYFVEWSEDAQVVRDLWSHSCLNGWTMGNVVSTPTDLATFWYDLFNPPKEGGFVNKTTLASMLPRVPMESEFCHGLTGPGSCFYGFGFNSEQLMAGGWTLKDKTGNYSDVELKGHLGLNWGSGVSPCGYNERFGFGICLAFTSSHILSCNLDGDNEGHGHAHGTVMCKVYAAALAAFGGPTLDCSMWELPPESPHRCEWLRE